MTLNNILFLTGLILCLIVIAYNFKSQNEPKKAINKIPFKPYDPMAKNKHKVIQMNYLNKLRG